MNEGGAARQLLQEFKGGGYLHGTGMLDRIAPTVRARGVRVALVRTGFPGLQPALEKLRRDLADAGITIVIDCAGPRPNAPLEDLARITEALAAAEVDALVSFGAGSLIDCVKAADVLRVLGGEIENYFGVGKVSERLAQSERTLTPHVAIQTAASSSAHLTKYSNITDLATGQKKLIVDEAIVPSDPVFDYATTDLAPFSLTADGALDGMAHILEVFFGATGQGHYDQMVRIAEAGLPLIVEHLPGVRENPSAATSREALGLATDLGGYAIMLGGTNGAHLTSFSLVDILSHGRACALMQPYYALFFSPVIAPQLHLLGSVLARFGHLDNDPASLEGRELGLAVAEGLFAFARSIDFPTTLGEVPGFGPQHLDRALSAAKNPQLKMKLENMPVPLTAELVDDYMGPVLQAAVGGELGMVRNL